MQDSLAQGVHVQMCLTVTRASQILLWSPAGIATGFPASQLPQNRFLTMAKMPTKTTSITPRSTDSTTADDCSTSSFSIGSDSKDTSNIFRTPKEFDSSTCDNKQVDDVLKLSPPPLLVLPGSEESIVDESFDLNSILLKVRMSFSIRDGAFH